MKTRSWHRLGACAVALAASASMAQTLPTYIDLTPQQSIVKDQGGRDTCGTFASAAALEALYRRAHGLTLDLSEQYLNHWSQQFALSHLGRPVPDNETDAGSVGGGGLLRPLEAMSRGLAVPVESTLPYIATAAYQNVNPGDMPSLNSWSSTYPQKAIDDFNLADTAQSYVYEPPTASWTTVMPQAALDAARYRATGIAYLAATDVDAYRRTLAAGREVIMEFRCCDGNPGTYSTQPWVLPAGSNGGGAGHVVLVVGYDDARQMFRIKNSWGSWWADQGYAWISYDLVRAAGYRAAYLQGVVSPSTVFDPFKFRHIILGRWQLNYDGWKGVLDIYNLPQDYVSVSIRNYRVGTLFMADGRIHRVNGYVSGNALKFWVDWTQPNPPASQLSGLQFTAYMSTADHRVMSGTMRDPVWGTYPVAMVKGSAPVRGVARAGGLSPLSYLGTWDFQHDGRKGRVEILGVNPLTRVLTGRYVDANGTAYSLSGSANADARQFSFTVGFATPQAFQGYLNGRELGVMGGTTNWGGMTFGFSGTRRP